MGFRLQWVFPGKQSSVLELNMHDEPLVARLYTNYSMRVCALGSLKARSPITVCGWASCHESKLFYFGVEDVNITGRCGRD
jgi:hypothetical protein